MRGDDAAMATDGARAYREPEISASPAASSGDESTEPRSALTVHLTDSDEMPAADVVHRIDHAEVTRLAERLRHRVPGRYERRVKPIVDRIIGAVLLVILMPVLLVVAVAVLVVMGRPVLLRQTRAGRGGRAFPMLKFRTMTPDRRRSHDSNSYIGPERRVTHKSPTDPRHTGLGRFMRKFSLDELPQLFNVLRGQMSLVGPRPELISLTIDYAPWQRTRHLVKPGLTGLWQTTERGRGLLLHQCIDLDLRYMERLSFREDVRILLRTPVALLRNRGVV